ncbi:MAG: hypothetical protein KatS3mg118_0351 [Paracoccaceae bacterium]|nr:MAG: hypothetical protein KatS3mg118_0351 [Paracoccaceae bacterium]
MIAPELEFYLVDAARDASGRAQPPLSPLGNERLSEAQIYRLSIQNPFAGIIEEMILAARDLGCGADVALAEFGPGQFEINLTHVAGALEAADQAFLLRLAIRETARRHGMEASFMAKTYGDCAGSGLHFHVSVLDAQGRNIFAGDAPDRPNRALAGAIGGLKRHMAASMLLFAPHLNSFRRFGPGTYAPFVAAWGARQPLHRDPGPGDDRGRGADRAPPRRGRRQRLSGAGGDPAGDAGGDGRGDRSRPPPPGARPAPATGPCCRWAGAGAVIAFQEDPFPARALGTEFARCYALMKEQEMARLNLRVTDVDYDVYLRSV